MPSAAMKKIIPALILIFTLSLTGHSQKAAGRLVLQQGQVFRIDMDVRNTVSQEAMGNAIDFTADGLASHEFKVTNSTDDNHTLHHLVRSFNFKFDGMGSKYSFDSGKEKDLKGFFGPTAKDILSKSYDMVIDPSGKVLLVKPEEIVLTKTDDRVTIIFNMLRDLTSLVYPPKKNEASFFKVLPDTAVSINQSWSESGEDAYGKFATTYTLAAITDTTIIVNLEGKSASLTKAEMMGTQTTTTMNNSYTGKIILDKATGIIREKLINTVSNGNTVAMGGNLPVTSKSTITIKVTLEPEQVVK
jgi:hypothetical protein